MTTIPSEVVIAVDGDRNARRLREVPASSTGWLERADLQRWVKEHPDLIEPNLLLITEEFDRWEGRAGDVRDRLDLLFLDADGRPLVVEMKRGAAPDRSESQALQYGAYCSQLKADELAELLAKTQESSEDEAREEVRARCPNGEPGKVRIRVVAETFPTAITTTILFLREHDIDIGCIAFSVYAEGGGDHILTTRTIIPMAGTEDYLVRARERKQAEATSSQDGRAANAIPLLLDERAIPEGTMLRLNVERMSTNDRVAFESLLAQDPQSREVRWVGNGTSRTAVHPHDSDVPMSIAAHFTSLRQRAGLNPAPGATHYWIDPASGLTLYELARKIEGAREAADADLGAGSD